VSAILKRALDWLGLVACFIFISINTFLRLTGQALDPKNELTLFICDVLRLVSAFLIPIFHSAPQIYLSALPVTPEHFLVGEKFCPRFLNTLTISDGRPAQWPMITFVAEHYEMPLHYTVLLSDEKTFASILSFKLMYICNSGTGHCISGPFEWRNLSDSGPGLTACFSPNGKHILVRGCHLAVQ